MALLHKIPLEEQTVIGEIQEHMEKGQEKFHHLDLTRANQNREVDKGGNKNIPVSVLLLLLVEKIITKEATANRRAEYSRGVDLSP